MCYALRPQKSLWFVPLVGQNESARARSHMRKWAVTLCCALFLFFFFFYPFPALACLGSIHSPLHSSHSPSSLETMDTTPKVSLDSLMSGLIDLAPPQDAPKKFKRVRGQPTQGQTQQTPTTTTPTQAPAPAPGIGASTSSPPTIIKTEPKQEPTIKAPPKANPSKQETLVAADMAAAAAAIFADPVPVPTSEPANVFTLTGNTAPPAGKKRKNKPKKKKNAPGAATGEATGQAEAQGNTPKKQKKNPEGASQRPGQRNNVSVQRRDYVTINDRFLCIAINDRFLCSETNNELLFRDP